MLASEGTKQHFSLLTGTHGWTRAANGKNPIALLEGLSKLFPGLQDTAEFGRIGRYYASESMLVWDAQEERYDADATPSYGEDTLEQFFERVVRDGMAGQDLGDASVF